MAFTSSWPLSRALAGTSTGGAQRHSPQVPRAEYDGGERQAFTPVASATSAVGNWANNHIGNRHSVSDNHENQVKEVINDDNGNPAHPAIASQLEQLAHRQ